MLGKPGQEILPERLHPLPESVGVFDTQSTRRAHVQTVITAAPPSFGLEARPVHRRNNDFIRMTVHPSGPPREGAVADDIVATERKPIKLIRRALLQKGKGPPREALWRKETSTPRQIIASDKEGRRAPKELYRAPQEILAHEGEPMLDFKVVPTAYRDTHTTRRVKARILAAKIGLTLRRHGKQGPQGALTLQVHRYPAPPRA